MYPVDVTFLTMNDWANSGHKYVQCLRSLGLKVIAFKGKMHTFMYPEQIQVHPDLSKASNQENNQVIVADSQRIRGIIKHSKVVHFKDTQLIDCGIDLSDKIVIAQHGGKTYRSNHEWYSRFWNNIATTNIIHCPDLLGLGLRSEHWILYPVDTELIRPVYNNRNFYVVGHYPSVAMIKGTATIVEAIENVKKMNIKHAWDYGGDTEEVSKFLWYSNIGRMSECDIYIEAMQLEANGRKYGTWGNQALEAAALGKVVITHSLYEDLYKKEYGEHPLLIANTKEELELVLKDVLSWELPQMREHQQKTREWAVKKHSIRPTAKRMWEKVYKPFFPKLNIHREFEKHISEDDTICQTLRDIGKLCDSKENGWHDKVKEKLDHAMEAAKFMNNKLTDYNHKWMSE